MVENRFANPKLFKAKARESWDAAAHGCNHHTPQIHDRLVRSTLLVFDLLKTKPGSHVPDVAAGAGDHAPGEAEFAGLTGPVLPTDISATIHKLPRKMPEKQG